MSELTVILPAYNEEEALGRVIDEITALPVDCDILVVDNNSIDETYNIATYKNVKVITEQELGKGNAMKRGFSVASTPYIIMMNSDYTYPACYIKDIFKLLKDLDFDVVIGERIYKEREAMSQINSFGNDFLSFLASGLYGKVISDICTGMWGFKKSALDKFHLTSNGFTLEADLFINSVRNECLIEHLPISYRPRTNGSKPKLKIGDGFKIGWFLIKNRFK